MRKNLVKVALSTVIASNAFLAGSSVALAQDDYPERPITAIVPFGAGGGNDILLRLMGKYANDMLGQPLIIDNKPGASGQIGWTFLAKSRPDGYTIGATSFPSMVLIKSLRPTTPYEVSDFTYVCNLQVDPIVWIVNSDSPYQSGQAFVQAAKQSNVPLNVGGDGPQSNVQLQHVAATEVLDIDTNFIPFGGSNAALTSLLGKNVDMVASTLSAAVSHINSGKLKALVVFSDAPVAALPNVPTANAEFGRVIEPVGMAVRGLAVPKDVPEARLKKLESTCQQIAQSESFLEETKRLGLTIEYMNSQQATQAVNDSVQAIEKLKALMQ